MRFKRGDLVLTNGTAGFARGRTVVISEVVDDHRVTVSYDRVRDLTINVRHLTPLVATSAPEDGETSAGAAASLTPERLTVDRRLALVELAKAYPHGLTDFELAARTGRKQTSIGKRRHELVAAGLAIYGDEKRPSDTGVMAKVWCATTFGLETLGAA